jgi:ABC-type nitrate/sulfonate/bicarbonate transport system substrate-binding protein
MSDPTPTTDKQTLRIALDWTPNTIHTGLFIAQHLGLYSSAGLDVHLLPPDPAYATTPAKQLEAGTADLAICPSESCIAYAENGRMQLQAIYAILQRNASAIYSRDLARLGDLGRKVYGSYNARFEDAIVRAAVERDGGKGEEVRVEREKGRLGLFEAARKGEVDATWVFVPWEGVEAELEGVEGKYFRLEEYGIPYGYSPVIARKAGGGEGEVSGEVLRRFVEATRQAYEIVSKDARAGVEALKPFCRPERSEEFLMKSQERINEFYGDGSGRLGTMSEAKWWTWIQWLEEQKMLEAGAVKVDSIFTNESHS